MVYTVFMVENLVIYGLYCTCHDDGIRYVGQTMNGAALRLTAHKTTARRSALNSKGHLAVYRWMLKHGLDNIEYKILEHVSTVQELDKREIAWIKKMGTYSAADGLNLTLGGLTTRGLKISNPAWGEDLTYSKMTNSDVAKIKEMLWSGMTIAEVAELMGKLYGNIAAISGGHIWTGVRWPIGPREKMRTSELQSKQRTGRMASPETLKKMSASNSAAWTESRKQKYAMQNKGEGNPKAKLAASDVRKIRKSYTDGESRLHLAEQYGVTTGAITRIVNRTTWKHVE